MIKYEVTFYEYGSIRVEAESVDEAKEKSLKRAKEIFKPEIYDDIEIACVEII